MIKISALKQISVFSAILVLVGSILYVSGIGSIPDIGKLMHDPVNDSEKIFSVLRESSSNLLAYGWGGVLVTLATSVFFFCLGARTESKMSWFEVSKFLGIVGAILCLLGFVNVALASMYYLLPGVDSFEKSALPFYVTAVYASIQSQQAIWMLGSFISYSLAVGIISVGNLLNNKEHVARNWLGIMVAICGVFWIGPFISYQFPPALVIANVFLCCGWCIWYSLDEDNF